MDPWDPVFNDDFLDFDDDNFTADALTRIPHREMLPVDLNGASPAHIAELAALRECKLFMNVSSVENIPYDVGCVANCTKMYLCEIQVMRNTSTFPLLPRLDTSSGSPEMLPAFYPINQGSNQTATWSLAEYFGDTKITIKLKARKFLRDVVVGTRVVKLSELLVKQREQVVCEVAPGAWAIKHEVLMRTTLKDHSVKQERRREMRTPPKRWLASATKSAQNTFNSASPSGADHNLDPSIEKQKMRILNPTEVLIGGQLSGSSYEPVATNYGHSGVCKRKGVQVVVHLDFRVVQLQYCAQLSMTAVLAPGTVTASNANGAASSASSSVEGSGGRRVTSPSQARPSPPSGSVSVPAPSSDAAPGTSTGVSSPDSATTSTGAVPRQPVHISELHFLAATAPAGLVVDVMRALSRKEALPTALELRHTPASEVATSPRAGAPMGHFLRPRRSLLPGNPVPGATVVPGAAIVVGAASSSNAVENASAMGYTPFEVALLFRQEQTVLEMLQRCGNLCFANITVGKASPLHAAVRGGSMACVEYVVRYIRKYGTRRINGPGARLWASSLSAKLEWRDAQDDTALSLVCRLPPTPNTHAIAMYLLIQGADAAAVTATTSYTPLMYACENGPAELVSTLLTMVKSPQDVLDGILNVGDVNSIFNNTATLDVEPAVRAEIQSAIASAAQAARSGALAYHLHTNARSNNILRGRNTADGGHFNPLSVYICEPCRREASFKRTALHLAVQRGKVDIVQQLLDIGMSCADIDSRGDNSLHIAARRGERALVAKLVEAEVREWNAYKDVVRHGKSLEVMHHRSQTLFTRNCAGDTPIDLALEARAYSAVDELLRGAMRAYGAIPVPVAKRYLRQLEDLYTALAPPSPNAAPSTTVSPPAPASPGASSAGHSQKTSSPLNSPSQLPRSAILERCLRTLTDTLLAQGELGASQTATPSSPPVNIKGSEARRPPPSPLRLFGLMGGTLIGGVSGGSSTHYQVNDNGSGRGAVEVCEPSLAALESKDDSDGSGKSAEPDSDAQRGPGHGKEPEEPPYDDLADSVEYMLALSPLGLKHVLDSAGGAAVSYLPAPGQLGPGQGQEGGPDA